MGFNTIVHESILINILKDIFLDEEMRSTIGFKGGTAAKLFYGLNRFSVDLDFDLLDNSKKEIVFDKIKSILEKYGIVKKFNIKRYTLFFLLDYKNKDLLAKNVKVEINTRDFNSKYERMSYLGVLMNVMCKEDMFAHKFVAMYERMGKTNRDIYDVHFFLENMWSINKDIVENRTKLKFKDFVKKCIDMIEMVDENNLLSGLGELLSPKQKFFVKTRLKVETLYLLKSFLRSI